MQEYERAVSLHDVGIARVQPAQRVVREPQVLVGQTEVPDGPGARRDERRQTLDVVDRAVAPRAHLSKQRVRGRGGLLAPERAVVRYGLESLEDTVEKHLRSGLVQSGHLAGAEQPGVSKHAQHHIHELVVLAVETSVRDSAVRVRGPLYLAGVPPRVGRVARERGSGAGTRFLVAGGFPPGGRATRAAHEGVPALFYKCGSVSERIQTEKLNRRHRQIGGGVFLGSAKASPEASENDALGRAASEPHGTTRTTATRGSPSRAASRHRRRVP